MDGESSEFTEPLLEANAAPGEGEVSFPAPPAPPPDSSHLLDVAEEAPAVAPSEQSDDSSPTNALNRDAGAAASAHVPPTTASPDAERGTPRSVAPPSSVDTAPPTTQDEADVRTKPVTPDADSRTAAQAVAGERAPRADVETANADAPRNARSDEANDDSSRYSVDGSVTDALTRDSGLHFESKEPERESRPSTGFVRTGHPVRDRLLAKAAEAQAKAPPKRDEADDLPGFSSLGVAASELDEIAAPRHDSHAPLSVGGTTLSSSNLLVFGTVCGLVAVASLFTFLIQFSPRDSLEPTPAAVAPTSMVVPTVAALATTAPQATVKTPPREKLPGPWRIGSAESGQKRIQGQIGQEPFLRAIQSAGISKNQAYRVYAALKDEKNLDRCRPNDEFIALVDSASGNVVAFEYIVSKEEVYQAREGKDGLLQGKRLDLKVQRQRVQGSMTITSESFADAARAGGLEPELGRVINKALDGHTSVSQFQRGDRLRVVAQEVTVLGEFYRYAGIEALEYLPVSGDPVRIYYFASRKRYYDAKGRAPGEGGWRRPVKDAPVTSKFNPNRLHPILKKRMPHNGTDFGAPTGTPVYASLYGTITKLGNYGANGNFIAIQHSGGYETGYSHLSRFESGLKVGDKVKTMQPIGYVGSTGRSTGPHLHFSAKKDGKFIDAESLHLDALTVLPPAERAAFAKIKKHYDGLLEAVALPPPLAVPEAPTAAPDPVGEMDLGNDGVAADPSITAIVPPTVSPTTPSATPTVLPPSPAAAPVPVPAAPHATPQPAAPGPVVATPASPPPTRFDSIYLSDKELMESQSAGDEGEVE